MTIFHKFPALSCLALSSFALLTACGEPAQPSETAEEYAARINGTAPAAPQPQTEQSQASSGQQTPAKIAPSESGPQAAPAPSPCGATSVAEYLGQGDESEIRQAITEKAQARGGVRFIRPGEAQTQDFNNNRLNVMYDAGGIIRDFRCG